MVDWLVAWGVKELTGFVFQDILLGLAQGRLEDYASDLFCDCISNLATLASKYELNVAAGRALKEFLRLLQEELETWGCAQADLKQYKKALNQFIYAKSVKKILGTAFKEDCKALDTAGLAKTWENLGLPPLPSQFDWEAIGKQYLRKVKALIRESEELRSILDSQNLEAIRRSAEELAGIAPNFDLQQYRESIRKVYGHLNLDALSTDAYEYKLRLWQVFVPQNAREGLPVRDIPKEHQKRLRVADLLDEQLERDRELEIPQKLFFRPAEKSVRSVLEILSDPSCQHTVILGDPGSGKSTLAQYLALNWAEKPSKTIPLLIELRNYTRDRNLPKDFLDFYHQGSRVICRLNRQQLHQQLMAGNAFVIFDGLDEVFERDTRGAAIREIVRFTTDYPKVRVMVTSRIIGYKSQPLRDAQFRHFTLQDLSPEQIREFLQKWHRLAICDETEKQRKLARLQAAIESSPAIGELAGNPLLLTMMAILNRNQELPRNRAELYNQASQVLLENWDVERDLPVASDTIDRREKQEMLRQVAYHMQAAPQGLAGNLIHADDLENIFTNYLKTLEVSNPRRAAKLIIEQLRERNFILCHWACGLLRLRAPHLFGIFLRLVFRLAV